MNKGVINKITMCAVLSGLVSAGAALSIQKSYACENGLYLRGDWLSGVPKTERLDFRKYRDLYVHLNGIGAGNLGSAKIQSNLKTLRADFPNTKVQGWLGLRVCDRTSHKRCVDLDRSSEFSRLLSQARKIWAAGFDGVHLDVEPVISGDRRLISLLRILQNSKPKDKILSLAGMSLALEGDIQKSVHSQPKKGATVFTWTKEYYQLLLPYVDQVMVMNYDTALNDPSEYERFVAWQTENLTNLFQAVKTELRIGVPVYQEGRPGVFNPKAENFKTATNGIRTGWKKQGCPSKSGLAVFIEDEFKKSDQAIFGLEW